MTEVIKKYRSIPVKMTYTTVGDIVKWNVLSIGIETELKLTPDNVRGIIDKYYSDFVSSLGEYNENRTISMFLYHGIDVKYLYDDTMVKTAVIWMSSDSFTMSEKKDILLYLIRKGLSVEHAIRFKSYL